MDDEWSQLPIDPNTGVTYTFPESIRCPSGIAVNEDGIIYVASSDSIKCWMNDQWNPIMEGLKSCSDIAFNSKQNIFIVE